MASQPNIHPCTFGCFEFFLEKNSILHGTTDILSVQRYFLFHKKLAVKNVHGGTHSEPPRMAVVLVSSEFAICKLMFSGCHGWHPLNAAQDRSGILFIARMVQQQPSTRGEALRDFAEALKRYKRIARRHSFSAL